MHSALQRRSRQSSLLHHEGGFIAGESSGSQRVTSLDGLQASQSCVSTYCVCTSSQGLSRSLDHRSSAPSSRFPFAKSAAEERKRGMAAQPFASCHASLPHSSALTFRREREETRKKRASCVLLFPRRSLSPGRRVSRQSVGKEAGTTRVGVCNCVYDCTLRRPSSHILSIARRMT